jgi:hypothetical protein
MGMCSGVLVTSSNTGTAIVPSGSGTNLSVRVVMPDGSSQGTAIQFSYGNSGSGNGSVNDGGSNISWKQADHEVISNDPKIDRMTPTGGSAGITVTIAQCPNLLAQIGYGSPYSTWESSLDHESWSQSKHDDVEICKSSCSYVFLYMQRL